MNKVQRQPGGHNLENILTQRSCWWYNNMESKYIFSTIALKAGVFQAIFIIRCARRSGNGGLSFPQQQGIYPC
jgi:hypothetical protein